LKVHFKAALESLAKEQLPLERCLSEGGVVDEVPFTVTIYNAALTEVGARAKIGVFFTEMVGGCSCGDGPYTINGYGEFEVVVEKTHSKVTFTILADD